MARSFCGPMLIKENCFNSFVMDYTDCLEVIKGRRLELELTHSDIADDLGVSPEYVKCIEDGTVDPPLQFFIRLLKHMGLTLRFGDNTAIDL